MIKQQPVWHPESAYVPCSHAFAVQPCTKLRFEKWWFQEWNKQRLSTADAKRHKLALEPIALSSIALSQVDFESSKALSPETAAAWAFSAEALEFNLQCPRDSSNESAKAWLMAQCSFWTLQPVFGFTMEQCNSTQAGLALQTHSMLTIVIYPYCAPKGT